MDMKNNNLFLVVMAGGSGTRFWPKSTSKHPKQFLTFEKNSDSLSETILQKTVHRFNEIVPHHSDHNIIVTTEALKEKTKHQFKENQVTVLGEPAGRNTAPCVFWAAKEVYQKNKEGMMLVMPADHFIANEMAFRSCLNEAIEYVKNHDVLATLGVKPTRPETGYGYLKCGEKLSNVCLKVDAFVEKPNLQRAESFVKEGNYLWNGGMFIWKAATILKEFEKWMPEMEKVWKESQGNIEAAYPKLTATSIDFGVMEKATNVVSFPLDCGWDDLGSFTSVETMKDVLGLNHEVGTVSAGEIVSIDSTGNIIDASEQLVALIGIHNLIVVRSGNTLLVADKNRAQDIKLIVEKVKKEFPNKL